MRQPRKERMASSCSKSKLTSSKLSPSYRKKVVYPSQNDKPKADKLAKAGFWWID